MFDLIAKVMEAKVMRMEVTEGKKRKLGLLLRKGKKERKEKKKRLEENKYGSLFIYIEG